MVANSATALILVISSDKERRKGTQIESMHTLKKKEVLLGLFLTL